MDVFSSVLEVITIPVHFFVNALSRILLALVVSIGALKLYSAWTKGACVCTSRLDGKTAVVTGGNCGLGLETARALARRGARVVLACRDHTRAERARDDILSDVGDADVRIVRLDLADLASVRRCAADLIATERTVDILVNNAGAAGLARRRTANGLDPVMQINHFGHFLLTNLLLGKLAASAPSRVVVVSSLGHRFARLDRRDLNSVRCGHWTRYANSKLCNVLFARALAARLPSGVLVNSLHPGVVHTEIFRRVPEPARGALLWAVRSLFKSAAEGAQTAVHLCGAPALAVSGRYWAECAVARESAAARDDALAELVWAESERLTCEPVRSPCVETPRAT